MGRAGVPRPAQGAGAPSTLVHPSFALDWAPDYIGNTGQRQHERQKNLNPSIRLSLEMKNVLDQISSLCFIFFLTNKSPQKYNWWNFSITVTHYKTQYYTALSNIILLRNKPIQDGGDTDAPLCPNRNGQKSAYWVFKAHIFVAKLLTI